MDLNELRKYGELMNELKLTAFEVSEGGRTFRMERGSSPAASAKTFVPESPASYEDKEETADASSLEIKSPMVGLFYSSSAEDKDDYVTVGSEFRKGDTICIIEAISQNTANPPTTRFNPGNAPALRYMSRANRTGFSVSPLSLSGAPSSALIVRLHSHPAKATANKMTHNTGMETLSDRKAAISVPVRIPTKANISMAPEPKESPSSPPMSRINPYLDGENKALCSPINKTEHSTHAVERHRKPPAATNIISISQNFAHTTTFRFEHAFAKQPANGEKIK